MHKIVAPTFMTEVLARACSSALVLLFAPFVAGGLGCTKYMNKASDSVSDAEVASDTFTAAKLAKLRPAVTEFCSACHAMPRPSSSAKSDWEMEVVQGFSLYEQSGRTGMDVPDEADTLRFFTSQAPESLSMPRDVVGISEATCFEPAYPAGFPDKLPPGITHLKPIELGNERQAAVLYADVSSGAVRAWWPNRPGKPIDHLATFLQPVHLETCDIDGDGLTDVVAADIGEFNASDTDLGRVMLARQVPVDQDSSQRSGDLPKFEKHVILDGLSRVSDVRPGDFNGDGRIDLVVAVFGWRKTGEILLLENVGMQDNGIPSFRPRVIDNRHGAVNTLPVDFNGDGHLDFIALISQEHEVIVAFKNDGKGSFTKTEVWAASDPSYGSSGIELTDMDGDNDLDLLYTNGDSFDRGVKPHHSIQWLENRGEFPYIHHHIAAMPGVQIGRSGDVDGDGDMDVIAASLIVGGTAADFQSPENASVVLFRQNDDGSFTRSMVESAVPRHLTVLLTDIDIDGKIDLVVGNFMRGGPVDAPDLKVFLNSSGKR